MEDVCFKVIKHMINRRLSMAFDTWHEHAREQCRMEYVCSKIVKRLKHRSVDRAFALWMAHLNDVSGKHERAGAVLKLWRHAGRGFGTCVDCGASKDLRIDGFERWSSIVSHMKEVRKHVAHLWCREEEQVCDLVMQTFNILKKDVQARRKSCYHAANLVTTALARSSRMRCFNAWKEYNVKPLLWITEQNDFELNLRDIKFSVPLIPPNYHCHTQFEEAVVKDLTKALGDPDVGIELLHREDKTLTLRLDFESSYAIEDANEIVARIQEQIGDPTSLLRKSDAGSALEKMEVLHCDEDKYDEKDEDFIPFEKGAGKRAQRAALRSLQMPEYVAINSHSSVDTSKKEMIARIAALRLHCASLEKQVVKYKEAKGHFAWCSVGINLTRWALYSVCQLYFMHAFVRWCRGFGIRPFVEEMPDMLWADAGVPRTSLLAR